jgi:hypothetical protein
MKLSFEVPSALISGARQVRTEVLGSDSKGSLVLLNGVPTRVAQQLPVGQTLNGTVVGSPGSTAQIVLGAESEGVLGPAQPLQAWGEPADPENVELMSTLRRYGIPWTREAFLSLKSLLQSLGGLRSPEDLDAAALLLQRRLPGSLLGTLRAYASGGLRLGSFLAGLPADRLADLRKAWSTGTLLERFTELFGSENRPGQNPALRGSLEGIIDSLRLQELISGLNGQLPEDRVYFQWPMFWSGQDLPDTLEGEAFLPRGTDGQFCCSLRVLANPPRLGPLEIGLHRVEKSLWAHFGCTRAESREEFATIFSGLRTALLALGWKSVKITTGLAIPRPGVLLAPAELPSQPSRRVSLDIKG